MDGFTSLLRRRLSLKPSGNEPDRRCGESSTLKLPPEILGVIFNRVCRNSTDLMRVSAVCSRWRTIAVQTHHLWTNIKAHVNKLNKRQTRAVLSRVDLFLSRAGDLPLDVEWHAYGNRNSIPHFYNLFRKKGPFIRWKTLSLHLNADITHSFGEFQECDSFSNLVLLTLVSQPPLAYRDHLNKTVSKKLDTLELTAYFECSPGFHTEYAEILHTITTLHTWTTFKLPAGPFPPNVTILRADTLPDIAMPYIRQILVNTLHLVRLNAFNLANIVLLEVVKGVDRWPTDVSIDLPSLLSLTLGGDSFPALSGLKAPSLEKLSIYCPQLQAQTIDGPFMKALRNGFQVCKLLALILDIHLDRPTTLEVLRFFPDITHLSLLCYDARHAEEMLWHVFPEDRRNFNICPSLHSVSVMLEVPPSDQVDWGESLFSMTHGIGDSLCTIESRWPGGAIWFPLSCEARKEYLRIYPRSKITLGSRSCHNCLCLLSQTISSHFMRVGKNTSL